MFTEVYCVYLAYQWGKRLLFILPSFDYIPCATNPQSLQQQSPLPNQPANQLLQGRAIRGRDSLSSHCNLVFTQSRLIFLPITIRLAQTECIWAGIFTTKAQPTNSQARFSFNHGWFSLHKYTLYGGEVHLGWTINLIYWLSSQQ